MTEPKIVVLGAGGFVGAAIFETLQHRYPTTMGLRREHFDIRDAATYGNFDFSNAVLIDCIARIDGSSEAVMKTNVDSLRGFIGHLQSSAPPSRYVYLSTTAANGPLAESPYVRSKQMAEAYLQKTLHSAKILRLSFPFGPGEKLTRLISRLILAIRRGDPLTLDNVTLNLTPIAFLKDHIEELIFSEAQIINFTDGNASRLHEIVQHLHSLMGKSPEFTLNAERVVDLEVRDPTIFKNLHRLDDALSEMVENVR